MRGWRAMAGIVALLAGSATAQDRTIQLVNPYAAGSTTDQFARALAPGLQARLGVPVVVVNRDGAAGGIGTASVARATPDGTTLLFAPQVDMLWREAGILHARLNHFSDAVCALERFLSRCQDTSLKARTLQILADLRQRLTYQ